MWANAQRDGHTAEYRRHPLRKFRNSIPCTTPQSLADPGAIVPCSNAANIGEHKTWWGRKVNFHVTKFCQGASAPENYV